MIYALIKDNIVVQCQPCPQEGFIEIPEFVVCGMVVSGYDYINPEKSLEDRRISQRTELKKQREVLISSPISGVQVRNSDDKENIKGAIDKWDVLGNPTSIPWIMEDNSVKLMSKQDLINIENEYTLRKMQSFETYRTLCAELCESDDPESITWPE